MKNKLIALTHPAHESVIGKLLRQTRQHIAEATRSYFGPVTILLPDTLKQFRKEHAAMKDAILTKARQELLAQAQKAEATLIRLEPVLSEAERRIPELTAQRDAIKTEIAELLQSAPVQKHSEAGSDTKVLPAHPEASIAERERLIQEYESQLESELSILRQGNRTAQGARESLETARSSIKVIDEHPDAALPHIIRHWTGRWITLR